MLIDKVVDEDAVPKYYEFILYFPVTFIEIDNDKIPYWFIWSSPVVEFKLIYV